MTYANCWNINKIINKDNLKPHPSRPTVFKFWTKQSVTILKRIGLNIAYGNLNKGNCSNKKLYDPPAKEIDFR